MHSLTIQTTLVFDHPILGSEIPKIVQQFVDAENFVNALDPILSDRLLIGKGSEHVYDHILITDPDSDSDGIFPDVLYGKLTIKKYRWPGGFKIEANEGEESLKAILHFTRQLEQALNTYQQTAVR